MKAHPKAFLPRYPKHLLPGVSLILILSFTIVAYTSTFKNGSEEGIVVLYAISNADGSIAAAVMVKELL